MELHAKPSAAAFQPPSEVSSTSAPTNAPAAKTIPHTGRRHADGAGTPLSSSPARVARPRNGTWSTVAKSIVTSHPAEKFNEGGVKLAGIARLVARLTPPELCAVLEKRRDVAVAQLHALPSDTGKAALREKVANGALLAELLRLTQQHATSSDAQALQPFIVQGLEHMVARSGIGPDLGAGYATPKEREALLAELTRNLRNPRVFEQSGTRKLWHNALIDPITGGYPEVCREFFDLVARPHGAAPAA
jgi:hypothetical protein